MIYNMGPVNQVVRRKYDYGKEYRKKQYEKSTGIKMGDLIAKIKSREKKTVIKTIDLDTKYVYTIDSLDNVYKNGKMLKGWRHLSNRCSKPYQRFKLWMKDGTCRNLFLHQLKAAVR